MSGSYPSSSASTSQNGPNKRACDGCHKRKLRCERDGMGSCKNCVHANLECTYNAIPQKKGPKGNRAKVITELRESQRVNAAKESASPPASPSPYGPAPVVPADLVQECVEYFFSKVYPTQPIMHRAQVQDATLAMYRSVEAGCLIRSLCAFVLLQCRPQLASLSTSEDSPDAFDATSVGLQILADALELRRRISLLDHPSTVSVIASFFLFGCHFSLEKHNVAWAYLRESTTLALVLEMDREQTYLTGSSIENIFKRRIFWLLFVTERAYSLQTRRPLTLHATIALPSSNAPFEEAHDISGFLHLVNLYRPFDDTFVGLWNDTIEHSASSQWLVMLHKQLAAVLPAYLRGSETQAVDLKVSQQWLRVMIWQLSISHRMIQSVASDETMTFTFPVDLAKNMISEISQFSVQAMNVHGVGLTKKLFDVACTLIDVMAYVPIEENPGQLTPRDYLNHYLTLITKLRGQDRYLPILLSKAKENLPKMMDPVPIGLPSSQASYHQNAAMLSLATDETVHRDHMENAMENATPASAQSSEYSEIVGSPLFPTASAPTPYNVLSYGGSSMQPGHRPFSN